MNIGPRVEATLFIAASEFLNECQHLENLKKVRRKMGAKPWSNGYPTRDAGWVRATESTEFCRLLERAMGIEPDPANPQVIERTHLASRISVLLVAVSRPLCPLHRVGSHRSRARDRHA